MKRNLIIILVLTSAFTSCSRKIVPSVGYNQIKQKANVSRNSAILNVTSPELMLNSEFQSQLKLQDSVLIYNDTIYSNYKSFTFKTKLSNKYKINVYSLCDCLGFKKYIFNPEILVINDIGKPIAVKLDSTYFNYDKGPLSLNKVWFVEPNFEGICNVTLYSNNAALQKDIYKFMVTSVAFTGTVFIPMVIPIKIKSTLIGKFYIKIEERALI